MKKRILISAYAISPIKGSEYGAAWDTVTQLAKEHELWVLYGMSDAHMGDTKTLKKYIKANPLPSVTFIEVRAGKLAMAINLLNKWGMGWFFYLAYYLWQKQALKAARDIVANVDIDVVHQLGPIGFREPGFLGKLNKPLVWGPIGGLKVLDMVLLDNKPLPARIRFSTKNQINYVQLRFSHRISEAIFRADVLLAATHDGQQTIFERYGRESYWMPEQGIKGDIEIEQSKFHHIHQQVQLVWSGSHIERKNMALCLDALAKVKQKNWVLHVLGTGPLTDQLKHKAGILGLSAKIVWHGHLNRQAAIDIMSSSHLHIITSIAEDNPAVIFEAMRTGVPTLSLDHCGMADVLCSKCAIKIIVDSHNKMANNIASALDHLLHHPEILADMALHTITCAGNYEWEKRLKMLNTWYDMAIERYNSPDYVQPLITLQNA